MDPTPWPYVHKYRVRYEYGTLSLAARRLMFAPRLDDVNYDGQAAVNNISSPIGIYSQ